MEDNARNRALIESRRAEIEARKASKKQQAASMKDQIEREPLTITMTAGVNGKLFGSVTAATIVEQLASRGIEVERKKVDVPENSLKTTGNFKVRIRLYGDEEAILSVTVEASNAREIEAEKAKLAAAEGAAAAPADDEAAAEAEAPADGDAGETADAVDEAPEDAASLDPEVMAMQAAADAEAEEEDEE
jgi:large subunit ribosomal protein L9